MVKNVPQAAIIPATKSYGVPAKEKVELNATGIAPLLKRIFKS